MATILWEGGPASVRYSGPQRTVSGIEIDQDSLDVLLDNLEGFGPAVQRAAATALKREAEETIGEAKEQTPVKSSNLKNSGIAKEPTIDDTGVEVTMGFGGAAAPYAVYVHEDLLARHRVGNAKFLERPLLERAGGMEARLAEHIRAELGL